MQLFFLRKGETFESGCNSFPFHRTIQLYINCNISYMYPLATKAPILFELLILRAVYTMVIVLFKKTEILYETL